MRHVIYAGGALAGALALLAACQPQEEPVAGRTLYNENCAACHGASGSGDGALAQGLGLTAPDLTMLAARNEGEFPMLAVMAKIDGYTRGPAGDDMMPEFGALLEGRTVLVDAGDGVLTPTPERLVNLAEYLRQMQR